MKKIDRKKVEADLKRIITPKIRKRMKDKVDEMIRRYIPDRITRR